MPMPDVALQPVDRARTDKILGQFSGLRIAIAGDVMLDHFIFGRVERISPEAPVPVVAFDREEFRPGGAANVAHNVRSLGGSVDLIGVTGRDDHAMWIRESLKQDGINAAGLVFDDGRPTTRKVRVVTSRNQQVARIDYESDQEVRGAVEASLITALESAGASAHAVVISDYLKGSVTHPLVAKAVGIARDRRIPLLVDPKIPHLDYYAGATLVTPNNAEAETASHMRIRTHGDARSAARAIRERLGCGAVLITRGEAGMWLFDGRTEGHLPATAREVADVTGAGDTVIAVLSLALAAGADMIEAATLANAAAGITVGKFGPSTVSPSDLKGV